MQNRFTEILDCKLKQIRSTTLCFDNFIAPPFKNKKSSTLRRLIKKHRVHAGSIPAISTSIKIGPPNESEVVLFLLNSGVSAGN